MSSATRYSRSRFERTTVPPPTPSDPMARYATLPLRIFLGVTFLYAGLQKFFDPGYLTPGSDSYIGSQLQSFATISPIGFLFQWFALPFVSLFGPAVIAVEVAVGLLILAGIWTRGAAVIAALLSFLLFLSATWDVQPYFLGSDSIYAVTLVTLALVGDGGILSLQAWWRARARSTSRYHQTAVRSVVNKVDPGRRTFLLGVGGTAVTIIWLLGMLPRSQRAAVASPAPADPAASVTSGAQADPFVATMPTPAVAVATPSALAAATDAPAVVTVLPLSTIPLASPIPSTTANLPVTTTVPSPALTVAAASTVAPTATAATAPTATATTAPTVTLVPAAPVGTPIGTLAQLQKAGGSLAYVDPASGDPAVVVGLNASKLAAFDAVCPHAGCTVGYSQAQRLLVCPCHRAMFDPMKAGAVVRGPARQPLVPLNVSVGPDGKIYAS